MNTLILTSSLHLNRWQLKMTYINVPQGESGDHHGCSSSVFPIMTVEDESTAGVFSQTALHGLQ